jgi:hypothetical protein
VELDAVPSGTFVGLYEVAPKGGGAAGVTTGSGSRFKITFAFPAGPIGRPNEHLQWDPVEAYKMSDKYPGFAIPVSVSSRNAT